MRDSKNYVEDIIYDEDYNVRTPTKKDDINYQIQTLAFLYKQNLDWPDEFKEDIKEYVRRCINCLGKT